MVSFYAQSHRPTPLRTRPTPPAASCLPFVATATIAASLEFAAIAAIRTHVEVASKKYKYATSLNWQSVGSLFTRSVCGGLGKAAGVGWRESKRASKSARGSGSSIIAAELCQKRMR